MELGRFVEEGGTLITEGRPRRLMAEYNLDSGVTVSTRRSCSPAAQSYAGHSPISRAPSRMAIPKRTCLCHFNRDPVSQCGFCGSVEWTAGGSVSLSAKNRDPNTRWCAPFDAAVEPGR